MEVWPGSWSIEMIINGTEDGSEIGTLNYLEIFTIK
jgi:hypothetical protein